MGGNIRGKLTGAPRSLTGGGTAGLRSQHNIVLNKNSAGTVVINLQGGGASRGYRTL